MYSNEEYSDMVYMYGFSDGNSAEARREYGRRFPNRNLPSKVTIQRVYERLRETGSVISKINGGEGPVIPADEDAILDIVHDDPGTSTRRVGFQLGISHTTVHRTLVRNGQYPFHLQKVQDLLDIDLNTQAEYCR